MTDKVYLLPKWLRLWHWTNAALIVVMAVSGTSLHFAAPGAFLVPFGLARDIHNAAGLMLAAAYCAFVAAHLATGQWRQYLPERRGFLRRLGEQTAYYLWGMFRGWPHPHPPTVEARFNALQQVIYGTTMWGVMPVVVVSGLIFLWPENSPDQLFGLDGLLTVAVVHYVAGFFIVLYALGHVYMATTGRTPGAMIRTMVTGWHEE